MSHVLKYVKIFKNLHQQHIQTSHFIPLNTTYHPSNIIPHPSDIIPHPSDIIPHPSSLIPQTSSLIPQASSLIPQIECLSLKKNTDTANPKQLDFDVRIFCLIAIALS